MKVCLLLFAVMVSAVACTRPRPDVARDTRTAECKRIEVLAKQSLQIGDDSAKVIEYFERQRWRHFDEPEGRVARIEIANSHNVITSVVYVRATFDATGRITALKVTESYAKVF